ncbi:MAG: PIN domain-containing protein [Planctomycetes bacterium]|nr:PIN domain-containing protein [Planctomycetota bacterium]
MPRVLLDTGPLVAFLDHRDTYHEWAVENVGELTPPLLTCEPVLAEACYLVRGISGGPEAVMTLLFRDLIRVPFRVEPEAGRLGKLMEKYSNVPMSLADACLVLMSETDDRNEVLTIDSDFRLYRKSNRRIVPTRMPPARG